MLDIFILEDNITQQFRIERQIEAIMRKIIGLISTWKLLRYLRILLQEYLKKIVIRFFLDLEIKGDEKQGIDVARAIREKDSTAIIVFVTTHFEFMLLTYHSLVGAIDFIDKI